jgi:tetratricopeptide (TPR) repeat protein
LEGLGLEKMISLDPVAAADCYQNAIALQKTTGDPRLRARLHYRLVLSYAFQGLGDESAWHFRESMALARSLNTRSLMARTLEEEAAAQCFLGRFAEALKRGQESLALYQELNHRSPLSKTHLVIANILLHLGDWEGCRAHAELAVALISWEREQGFTLWAHTLYSAVALANDDYGLAKQYGLEAIRLARQTEVRYQNSPAHSAVGVAALLSGDRDEARRNLSESLRYFETGTMLYELLLALLGVAFFLAHCGDEIPASRIYAAIRHYPHIADSVFCQQVAGRHLETLIGRLTPEQLAAVHAAPAPSDLRVLAAEMRARLEAMG